MRNLSELRTEVKNHIKTGAISDSRLNEFANDSTKLIARGVDLAHLRDELTFSSVASTRRYYLETDILRVLSVYDQTNDRELTRLPDSIVDRADPDRSDTGVPYSYALGPMTEFSAQMTTTTTVTVVSSDAADGSTKKVRINGLVGGVEDTELIALNGTTPAVSTKSFSAVFGIRKQDTTSGKVTVTETGVGTVLATIAPAKKVTQYQALDLFNIPSGVNVYRVKFYRVPRRLVNDQDMPELPEVYERLMLTAMLMYCREELQDFKRADELRVLFERDLMALKANQGQVRNTRRRWGGRSGVEGNRLGSNFPGTFIIR